MDGSSDLDCCERCAGLGRKRKGFYVVAIGGTEYLLCRPCRDAAAGL